MPTPTPRHAWTKFNETPGVPRTGNSNTPTMHIYTIRARFRCELTSTYESAIESTAYFPNNGSSGLDAAICTTAKRARLTRLASAAGLWRDYVGKTTNLSGRVTSRMSPMIRGGAAISHLSSLSKCTWKLC